MSIAEAPLLRLKAAGFGWAVPVTDVARVDRLEDADLDFSHGDPVLQGEEDDGAGRPLATLEPWQRIAESPAGRRLLHLRQGDRSVHLVVDEIAGQATADGGLFPLPPLPFVNPPPISQIARSGSELLPLVDLSQLRPETEPAADVDDGEAHAPTLSHSSPSGPASPPDQMNSALTASPTTEPPSSDHLELILLPALDDDGESPLIPALSASQVLSVEPHESPLPLPGLPLWCHGLVWWQDRPIPVFDLPRRLSRRAPLTSAGRRVVVAVPGGDGVPGGEVAAFTLEGTCRPMPLPERALSIPASSPLADGIHALFQLDDCRLAVLDLKRWYRRDHE